MGEVRTVVGRTWLGAAAGVAVFVLGFPHRFDYAGHFLAGFGGTLLLLTMPLALITPALRWQPLGFACVAIALGAALEATVFRLAGFDVVDFASQSLGACLAAAAVTGRPGHLGSCAAAALSSLLFLLAGAVLAFS